MGLNRPPCLMPRRPAPAREKHPCLESSPDPAFFPFFSGFRVRLSRTFPQCSPQAAPSGHAGGARRGGPGRPEGDSFPCRTDAVRPGVRRRVPPWGFPRSLSRWYSSLMSGAHLLADSAAMWTTSLGRLLPPPMWRPPLMVPLSRGRGARPAGRRPAGCRSSPAAGAARRGPGGRPRRGARRSGGRTRGRRPARCGAFPPCAGRPAAPERLHVSRIKARMLAPERLQGLRRQATVAWLDFRRE